MINIPIDNARKITELTKLETVPEDGLLIVHDGTGVKALNLNFVSVADVSIHHIYVDLNGNDETGDGTLNKPYRTLQKAYDSIPPYWLGDVYIYIAKGVYEPISGTTLLSMHGQNNAKHIYLTGVGYSATGDNTFLRGKITCTHNSKFDISNLRLQVTTSDFSGNLIDMGGHSSIVLRDCWLYGGNTADEKLNGYLVNLPYGCTGYFLDTNFSRSENAVIANCATLHMGNCIIESNVNKGLTAGFGALIDFQGTNNAPTKATKNNSVIYINSVLQ